MNYSLGLYEKAIPKELFAEGPGGVSSVNSLSRMCGIAAKYGFDRLEISIDETDERLSRLDWSASKQRELAKACRLNGAPIRTMCLSGHRKYPMGSHDPAVRDRSMEIMEKAIHFAANANISLIQLAGYDVYYETGDDATRGWFTENLLKSAQMAASEGVLLGFETMETPFMDTVKKAMDYVTLIGSPWLGVYPDIGNLQNAAVLYGHEVTKDLALGDGHIFAIHLKETKPGVYRDMDFGSGGHTRYVDCIEEALRMGVRLFTGEFWSQPGQDYTKVIPASSVFLREKIETAAKKLGL